MKLLIGNTVAEGELFIGTDAQFSKYHQNTDLDNYEFDNVSGQVILFSSFIVEHTLELDKELMIRYDITRTVQPYVSVRKSLVRVLPDYDDSLLESANKLRDKGAPISEAFELLGMMSSADAQEELAIQWYGNGKSLYSRDSSTKDKMSVLSYHTDTLSSVVFNHDLSKEQMRIIKRSLMDNNGELLMYKIKKNPIIPSDLNYSIVDNTTSIDKDSITDESISTSKLLDQNGLLR